MEIVSNLNVMATIIKVIEGILSGVIPGLISGVISGLISSALVTKYYRRKDNMIEKKRQKEEFVNNFINYMVRIRVEVILLKKDKRRDKSELYRLIQKRIILVPDMYQILESVDESGNIKTIEHSLNNIKNLIGQKNIVYAEVEEEIEKINSSLLNLMADSVKKNDKTCKTRFNLF